MVVTSFAEFESERGKGDVKVKGSYHKYSNFSKRIDDPQNLANADQNQCLATEEDQQILKRKTR
jgi:hypothetical protein